MCNEFILWINTSSVSHFLVSTNNTLEKEQDLQREHTHGEMIELLFEEHPVRKANGAVFIEIGSGLSTVHLAKIGRQYNATVYSCDINAEKIDSLRSSTGAAVNNIKFLTGDSLQRISEIVEQHQSIDFIFLDGAASAMQTFREFQILEKTLQPGALILIDNAALPGESGLLTPCRKGKIVVPYLLASAYWEVRGHPAAGDSMISALRHKQPDYADPAYEMGDFVDPWQQMFQQAFHHNQA